ncbi:unnamed protein product [Amoebophrya sp. A120]|nr:unnamed protein product [Amoebophrya sp. A120]|eukprot:GSA120T00026146001.1
MRLIATAATDYVSVYRSERRDYLQLFWMYDDLIVATVLDVLQLYDVWMILFYLKHCCALKSFLSVGQEVTLSAGETKSADDYCDASLQSRTLR